MTQQSPPRWRVLLHCLLLGAALHGLRALAGDAPEGRPQVPLEVWADDEASIRQAVLIDYALRGGALERDQVLRERLARNARFLRLPGEPVQAAVELGLHRTDPVARARLSWLAEELLLAQNPAPEPDDATLRAFLKAHPARYERPAALRLEHVFLSQRREDLEEAQVALDEALRQGAAPGSLGDPTSLPRKTQLISTQRVDATFGGGFAESLADAPLETWHGPVRSSYGVHFVRVLERRPASLPELEAVRPRVLGDWQDAQRGPRLDRAVARLREGYDVRVRGGDA